MDITCDSKEQILDELFFLDSNLKKLFYEEGDITEFEQEAKEFFEAYDGDISLIFVTKKEDGINVFLYPMLCEYIATHAKEQEILFNELISVIFEKHKFDDDLFFSRVLPNSRPIIEYVMKNDVSLLFDEHFLRVISIANKLPGTVAYSKIYYRLWEKHRDVKFEIASKSAIIKGDYEVREAQKTLTNDINDVLFYGVDMNRNGYDLRYILLRYCFERILDLGDGAYEKLVETFFDVDGEYGNFIDQHFLKLSLLLEDRYGICTDFVTDLVDKKENIINSIKETSSDTSSEDIEEIEFLTRILEIRPLDYSVVNF